MAECEGINRNFDSDVITEMRLCSSLLDLAYHLRNGIQTP
jgi:hypothetical protein